MTCSLATQCVNESPWKFVSAALKTSAKTGDRVPIKARGLACDLALRIRYATETGLPDGQTLSRPQSDQGLSRAMSMRPAPNLPSPSPNPRPMRGVSSRHLGALRGGEYIP